MKVSPEARRLAKYKERTKEISVVNLQFDVTFCTSILCAPSHAITVTNESGQRSKTAVDMYIFHSSDGDSFLVSICGLCCSK